MNPESIIKRVKTGIDGLDSAIGGGYPAGTDILITGSSGTGKTTFCAQFIYKGIRDYNESGIYVTLEERPEDLREEMLSIGWDLEKFEHEHKLIIIDAASSRSGAPIKEDYTMPKGFDIDTLILEIHKASQKINAKRLVIDSIPSMELKVQDAFQIRQNIYRLSAFLLETKLTSLLTTEITDSAMISRYGIEEFICRGVIVLGLEDNGFDFRRTLRVRKLRGTKHTMRKLPFEIQEDGIFIFWS